MLFLALIAIVFIYLFYTLYWKRRDYPPGPVPLPIVGNLLGLFLGFFINLLIFSQY